MPIFFDLEIIIALLVAYNSEVNPVANYGMTILSHDGNYQQFTAQSSSKTKIIKAPRCQGYGEGHYLKVCRETPCC